MNCYLIILSRVVVDVVTELSLVIVIFILKEPIQLNINKLQKGTKYSEDQNTGLVQYSNGEMLSSCRIDRYPNGIHFSPLFKWSHDFTI